MIVALVADCNKYLGDMETRREALEGFVASGKADEAIRDQTSLLAETIISYKNAAKFCRKHAVKPKAKAKAQSAPSAPEPAA